MKKQAFFLAIILIVSFLLTSCNFSSIISMCLNSDTDTSTGLPENTNTSTDTSVNSPSGVYALTDEQKRLLAGALSKKYSNATTMQEVFIKRNNATAVWGASLSKSFDGITYNAESITSISMVGAFFSVENYGYTDHDSFSTYVYKDSVWTRELGIKLEESVFSGIALGNLKNHIDEFTYDTRNGEECFFHAGIKDYIDFKDIKITLNGENLETISFVDETVDEGLYGKNFEYVKITYSDIGTTEVSLPSEGSSSINDGFAKIGKEVAILASKNHCEYKYGAYNIADVAIINDLVDYSDKDSYWYVEVTDYIEPEIGIVYLYKISHQGKIVESSICEK